MQKYTRYLLLILIAATILRFIGLEYLSPPLNRDEAGIGYNAYSLLKTGKDEHGASWPLSFRSIGDYKMPGYIYLSMIPIKIFGLSVFSVRFWSALGGVLAVAGIYFVSLVLFLQMGVKPEKAKYQALIPAFLLAINPWHLHYSRLAFEANFNLTLFIWSNWFLLKGLKDNRYIFGCAILWVAMQFMYSSTFIFLPAYLFIIGLLLIKFKHRTWILNNKILISCMIILCMGSFVALKGVAQVSLAKQSITIFSDPYLIDRFNNLRGRMQTESPILAKIVYNKVTYFGPILIQNYLKTFSPGFLFNNAINHPWHGIYGQGFFYWIDGVCLLLGLVFLLRSLFKTKDIFPICFILIWMLVSPVASAITIDAPHATRSLYLLPVLLIISSMSLWEIGIFLKQKLMSQVNLTILLLGTLYIVVLIRACYQYVAVYPLHQDAALFPGIKNAIVYADSIKKDRLVYMGEVSSSAYLYYLFYNQIDPRLTQTAHWKGADTARLIHIESVGQWRFVDIMPQTNEKIIWIGRANKSALGGLTLLKQFTNPQTGIIEWNVYEN